MEQVSTLIERIRMLKRIASSMQEGAIHTQLFPEIDKILALPDDLVTASVNEREAVTRQVREYEQAFDQLGYSLLKQIMPPTGVSPIFKVVKAAEDFKKRLHSQIGQTCKAGDKSITLDHHHYKSLTRYSLSIGTPPVTSSMQKLVSRILLGKNPDELTGFIDLFSCNPIYLDELLRLIQQLISSSLHYCTSREETDFLDEAAEFVNFEGGRLFNRVLITESPKRVIHLIQDHVFDKFGLGDLPPLRLVEGIDRLDGELIAAMQAEPNQVFVVQVTRIPYSLFLPQDANSDWRSVIGRLVLIDCSERAQRSNTTIVYTLFPHVAETLRNIQSSFAGRPANTQIQLRRVLEGFSLETLGTIRQALEKQIAFLAAQGVLNTQVDDIRIKEWHRFSLFDYLSLVKLHRLIVFLEVIAGDDSEVRRQQGTTLRQQIADDWMAYFYKELPQDKYSAVVVPGGGRGILALIGEYHQSRVNKTVSQFRDKTLKGCWAKLTSLKQGMQIPQSSNDEIQAAIKQSQLKALSPTQWRETDKNVSFSDYLTRRMGYRLVNTASRLTKRSRIRLNRAAFRNLTGRVAALLKKAFSYVGLGAYHGHLEGGIGKKISRYDRKVRDIFAPMQELLGKAQISLDNFKGGLDPIAISEIESILKLVEIDRFYPILIVPQMSWSYGDVFPENSFPKANHITVPLNERHEMDPLALLAHIEEIHYRFRHLPELFELICQSMLLVINSPHNPTGVYYRRETILQLLKIASDYQITVVDDNSYHKLVFKETKASEQDLCVAQLYERYRSHFSGPVRLLTAGATTKGLQGAGDRTGILFARDKEAISFAHERASMPHQMSLFLTRAKLETGKAAKHYTAKIENIAGEMLKPGFSPHEGVRELLKELLPRLGDADFPIIIFETLLEGYEKLLRCRGRSGTRRHLGEVLSQMVAQLKSLRLERHTRQDIEQRIQQVASAIKQSLPKQRKIVPQGAFYYCIGLCDPDNDRGLKEFLYAISRNRKIDVTYAGSGFVRLSLGGLLVGDAKSYDRLGKVVLVNLQLLLKYWQRFEESGRDTDRLDELFLDDNGDWIGPLIQDLAPIVDLHPPNENPQKGLRIAPSERKSIYCIEEGRSIADKVFVEASFCSSVEELVGSHAFCVIYRRLLKVIYSKNPTLSEFTFTQLENQFGPLRCLEAYHDRQLIDAQFRQILHQLYKAWHSQSTVKVLSSRLNSGSHSDKVATMKGRNQKINELINELMYVFKIPPNEVTATTSFDIGFEMLSKITAPSNLPTYLKRIIEDCAFSGATALLNPTPTFITGATKRIGDYRYGFIRRDKGAHGFYAPDLEYFRQRLGHFAANFDPIHYICKAVQVGPFKMLLMMHKSFFHLLSDELRLFPQIEAVQNKAELCQINWQGVLLFGLPTKVMDDSYKTGYIIDYKEDGAPLPVAWVVREDATDYVGFLKKSLLTLHNEQVKALGGMPVHGAMVTITFVNGLRKTLVFSADSGTGKSETITAMMEQAVSGKGVAKELLRIDILAGDMLSLWRGEDNQVYAFGTETGDFLRLSDITESWQTRYRDLLKRGSYSNPDHPTNPRVTIPGICDAIKVLSPTRVNCFFYINNYEVVRNNSVELSDNPHHILKTVLVQGLRKNKGTSGDQPNLRAGLIFAGRGDLVSQYGHIIDELFEWQERTIGGTPRTCLVYRDGAPDIFMARELVAAIFKDQHFTENSRSYKISDIEYDLMENIFWVIARERKKTVLDRQIYDQIYEPLVSTFCGNPFIDPNGMETTLGQFAESMRKGSIHTGVIKTQLARPDHEFSGPEQAAQDVISFLLEDEEVNARFQRNKEKVNQAMQKYYSGVLTAGRNLPVELEGYNLLLLEKHESTTVRFQDSNNDLFTISTPFYSYKAGNRSTPQSFVPAVGITQMLQSIADICANPDYDLDLEDMDIATGEYDCIRHWNNIEELTYQILLINGVIMLGSSETEIARFPKEVRKAHYIAKKLIKKRSL